MEIGRSCAICGGPVGHSSLMGRETVFCHLLESSFKTNSHTLVEGRLGKGGCWLDGRDEGGDSSVCRTEGCGFGGTLTIMEFHALI